MKTATSGDTSAETHLPIPCLSPFSIAFCITPVMGREGVVYNMYIFLSLGRAKTGSMSLIHKLHLAWYEYIGDELRGFITASWLFPWWQQEILTNGYSLLALVADPRINTGGDTGTCVIPISINTA